MMVKNGKISLKMSNLNVGKYFKLFKIRKCQRKLIIAVNLCKYMNKEY